MIKRLKKIFGIGPKPVPPFEKRELEIPLYNEFKNNLGSLSRQHVINNFSKKKMLEGYLKFYQNIVL